MKYDPAECAVFQKTNEVFGGLSNMAPGFPMTLPGIPLVHTSEALYQACRFPTELELQRQILATKNPMKAKMMTKPHRHLTRPDWETSARVPAMRWALRVKLWANPVSFGNLLSMTGLQPIVEKSHRDTFWGTVEKDGTLHGDNVLGCLLMELREELREHGAPMVVPPPDLPNFMLLGRPAPTCSG